MRFPFNSKFLPLIICAFFSTTLSAQVYRWVDDSGKVHFSDQPQNGAQSVNIRAPVSTSSGAVSNRSEAPSALERQRALAEQFEQQRLLREEEQQKAAERQAKVDKYCIQLRNKLLNYKDADILYGRDEKGEKYYLDKVAKEREIAKLESLQRQRCQ